MKTAVALRHLACVDRHVLAWQFHLEDEAAQLERWLVGHAVELAQAGIPPQRLRDQAATHGGRLEPALQRVMGAWLAGAGSSNGRA